jgi:hypothetical protein
MAGMQQRSAHPWPLGCSCGPPQVPGTRQ